jgi:protein subunit release factor A
VVRIVGRRHNMDILPHYDHQQAVDRYVVGSHLHKLCHNLGEQGGQSINKTKNTVQLLHKPTGIRVSCQETRSLALNRRLARRLIAEKACLGSVSSLGTGG